MLPVLVVELFYWRKIPSHWPDLNREKDKKNRVIHWPARNKFFFEKIVQFNRCRQFKSQWQRRSS